MAENKGKPSGKVAKNKKDAGRQGDLKEIGSIAGAKKKRTGAREGELAVTGTISRKR